VPPTFAGLGVPDAIARGLERRGITEPFPIQVATIPDALAGRDVCGRAPTGSGKTLAFGIPLAARVTHAGPKAPKALVLVPTRELAAQVQRELAGLLQPMGRNVQAFYGGVGIGPQITALRKGVDVAVACPGRLADLVERGAVRLDRVDLVVLDEADRMADMGFLPEVRRLLDQVGPDRQTLLFSATLDGDVDVLIRRYQRDPARHGVDREEDEPVNRHVLWTVERDGKLALAAEVARAHWPTIVFTRTKHGADRVARQIGKLGVDAVAIHGNRSQAQRERALRDFTSGRAQALIATDVAARGIHVDGVASVVHFDAPPDPKDFVHRSGRTGRAGAEGLVVTLTPAAEGRSVAKMMRKAGAVGVQAEVPDVAALGSPAPRPASTALSAARSDTDDRPARRDRGSGRTGRPDRSRGSDRTDRTGARRGSSDRTDRSGARRDRPARTDRTVWSDRSEGSDRTEGQDRTGARRGPSGDGGTRRNGRPSKPRRDDRRDRDVRRVDDRDDRRDGGPRDGRGGGGAKGRRPQRAGGPERSGPPRGRQGRPDTPRAERGSSGGRPAAGGRAKGTGSRNGRPARRDGAPARLGTDGRPKGRGNGSRRPR